MSPSPSPSLVTFLSLRAGEGAGVVVLAPQPVDAAAFVPVTLIVSHSPLLWLMHDSAGVSNPEVNALLYSLQKVYSLYSLSG